MDKMRIALITRVKQGDLYAALKRRGWTQTQAAEFLGMHFTKFNDMINLRHIPVFTVKLEAKLIDLTGKTVEQLFPREFNARQFLGGHRVFVEMGSLSAQQLASSGIRCLPSRSFQEAIEIREQIGTILEGLRARERLVVGLRFGLDDGQIRTQEEVGEELGITRKRAGQIEMRAMKRIRQIRREMKARGEW